jgi:hypothetical protein
VAIMRHTPSQVLDMQGALAATLTQGRATEYVTTVARSIFHYDLGQDDAGATRNAAHIYRNVRVALNAAHTFHVKAEMTDLVTWAAAGLDDDMGWRPEFLPTQVGFVYFDSPLLVQDVRGRNNKIHAILWAPAQSSSGPGTALYEFSDLDDPDDTARYSMDSLGLTQDELAQVSGRLAFAHVDMIFPGDPMGPAMITPSDDAAARILADGDAIHEFTNPTRLFTAYVRLLGQTLVKSARVKVDRAALRRAHRRGLPGMVTTVTLRNVEYVGEPRDGESHVEWSHRWIVRGHWRRQPCGPAHPLAEPDGDGGHVAIIYINPYVKGPDDKPLVVTNKVYDLAR